MFINMSVVEVVRAVVICCLLFLIEQTLQDDVDLPPAIPGKLVAESYIVVDPKALERYLAEEGNAADAEESMREDVEFYITEVNRYYETLERFGLDIQLRIVEIKLLDINLVSENETADGDIVLESTLLHNFGNFLTTDERKKDEYDFAVLLTGFNLAAPGFDVTSAGYAQKATMCTDYARSVVQLHGIMETAAVLANQVGLILGAEPDPVGAPYIMATQVSTGFDGRVFDFSKLSAEYILNYLHEESAHINCLRETNPSSTIPNIKPEYYDGGMHDIHRLCVRAQGPTSTPCTSSFFYNKRTRIAGDSICFHVACRHASDPRICITTVKTPEGMPCAKNKGCYRGKCMYASGTKYRKANSECLFGDDLNPEGLGQSCPKYLANKTWHVNPCEEATTFSTCCETCRKYATGIQDCPYGDAASVKWNDVIMTCADVVADSGKNAACVHFNRACCKTCHVPDSLKDSTCPYGDDNYLTVNEVKQTCGEALMEFGKNTACANTYVRERCCDSCKKPQNSRADCPYGDDDVITYDGLEQTCTQAAESVSLQMLCRDEFGQTRCCDTCRVPPGESPDCPYGDVKEIYWNDVPMTCAEIVAATGRNELCGTTRSSTQKKACCKTCQAPFAVAADCPYGDDNFIWVNGEKLSCRSAIGKYGKYNTCTNSHVSARCCFSCGKLPGAPPDCPFGNENSITVNGEATTCETAAYTFTKSRLCSSTLKAACCATCA